MTHDKQITVSRTIDASAQEIFAILSNPERHVELDDSGFVRSDEKSNRIQKVGDVFTMNMSGDHMGGEYQTDNHVVGYSENSLLAWETAPAGTTPPGWEWVWRLEQQGPDQTLVTHTYDWSGLDPADEMRQAKARAMTSAKLEGSLDRLAALAESA
jgi:uncharacterized protein YndB with AHSA1/START domain